MLLLTTLLLFVAPGKNLTAVFVDGKIFILSSDKRLDAEYTTSLN